MRILEKEYAVFLIILLAAIAVRVLFLWVSRPEFVGWFNHTYYYYVETRGLLTEGRLPYPDMPLLFYLYALTAKILSWLGLEGNAAVVTATRFWMCVIPSVTAVVVYLAAKNINEQEALDPLQWAVVGISAFLPLSVLHLPEFSQKNLLGIFLLAILILGTKRLLDAFTPWRVVVLLFVFTLIVLTHFGSAGAAVLYALSVMTILSFQKKNYWAVLKIAGIGFLCLAFTLTLIYWIDSQRFYRIFFYLRSSLDSSFIGLVFSEAGAQQKVGALLSILFPFLTIAFLYREYHKHRTSISESDRIFWLCNILFAYLLLLPVYDRQLWARFILFLSIPLLIIILYLFKYSAWGRRVKTALAVAISFGAALMVFGEYMSLKMHGKDQEAILLSLQEMHHKARFGPDDLVITKNGAEHICNWFFGTKAGVITALNRKDFDAYQSIYILNPIEGSLDFRDVYGKRADNEAHRYIFMMRNIPVPRQATRVYESSYLELFKIERPPEEWEYDADGNWMSYGK